MKYKNIRNVQKLNEEENAFLVMVDIDFDGTDSYESVEYCARQNGGGLCDNIIADILQNKITGKISNFKYPTKDEIKEEKIQSIKYQRNMLLTTSDWTQLPDVPKSTKLKWASYRQQLRDITNQLEFPDNVVWPTQPK